MKRSQTATWRRLALGAGLAAGAAALLFTYQEPLRRGMLARTPTAELRTAAQRSPDDRVLVQITAERLLREGQPREALSVVAGPAEKHRDDAALQVLLGRAHFESGDTAAAGQVLNRVLLTRPDYAPARFWMAEVLYRQGFEDTASDLFQEVTRLDPDHGPAWERAGELQLKMEHYADALRMLERSERLSPTARGARLRGAVLRSLGRAGEAEAAVRQAVSRDPQDPLAHYALADLLQGKSGPEPLGEARQHLDTAVRLEPTPDNLKLLGLVCRRQGDLRASIAAYRRMVELAPASAEGYLLLGQCYQARGRRELAARVLAIYHELEPLEKQVSRAVYRVNISRGDPAAQVALVRTYLEVGRQDLALETLTRLRRRDPTNPALPRLEREARREPTLRIPPLPPDPEASAS